MTRHLALLLFLFASCGGGGGGGGGAVVAFALSGSFPAAGSLEAGVDGPIVVTFTRPADLATVTEDTVLLERRDGMSVPYDFDNVGFNSSNVRVIPRFGLEPNELYRLVIKGTVRSEEGAELGEDVHVCFITANPEPTVLPNQVVDLGDQLSVPRFLARALRLADGRWMVFGGYTDPATVTDTIEVWDPDARTFRLLPVSMNVPRAEHTVTLLNDGRVVIAGGVSAPGGAPLASTEIFDPSNNGIGFGPPLLQARRWHAASRFEGGATVMVTGGFDTATDDTQLGTGEILRGNAWEAAPGVLSPRAQHVQELHGFDDVYVGVGNLLGQAGTFRDGALQPRGEGDARFRGTALPLPGDRLLVVGGDTRSSLIYDFVRDISWLATGLLRTRRGAHSLTYRDGDPHLFLVAGGFQISAPGKPALDSLEVVRYMPIGPFTTPDLQVHEVTVHLPVPFAGHVGFNDPSGATVLAGGYGDGVGPHSRRVVMVLDVHSTPALDCD